MKLNVPFYKQTTPLNCGPMALKMVFAFFGKEMGIELLEEKAKLKEGKAVSTVDLAIAAADLGYRVKLFSRSLHSDESNMQLDYYKENVGSGYLEELEKSIKQAREKHVEMLERELDLDELLSYVSTESVPIVLLDWKIIKGEDGYQGHFVPVVGYDKETVCFHNQGLNDTEDFMEVSRELFEKARKAKGTDEDVLVVYRS